MTEKKAGTSFEKSMDRLETIVSEMEDGDLSLDAMITRFEEGQKLLKRCSTKLNEVERKIEVLVKKGDQVEAEEFDEPEEETKGASIPDPDLSANGELF